nr:hypothetical protein Iba_scaffold15588CG0010 [Ipomoea batatas]
MDIQQYSITDFNLTGSLCWCGHVICVMFAIGVEMMMEAMLYYFVLGSMKIVVHSLAIFELILRVVDIIFPL